MATMTTPRPTPSLAIAPTQNTAPVYEFRCLYTHDLRKKKKLWHDGSLRYHTFNKRVMVYDDTKNYIGDSHWRAEEDLQEGTELKLDKGVLIDVGERIGQTETDLTELLEKRRPQNASSPARAPLQPISLSSTFRSNVPYSHQRPKTLSAVLGISQRPIGRARLPMQSPYEQLHHVRAKPSHQEEPPAKRPRVVLEKENVEPERGGVWGPVRARKTTGAIPVSLLKKRASGPQPESLATAPANSVSRNAMASTSASHQFPEHKRDLPPADVIDISSEDESPTLPSSLLQGTPKETAVAKKSASTIKKHVSTRTPMAPSEREMKKASVSLTKATKTRPGISMPPLVPNGTSHMSSSARLTSNKLRMTVHKPRQKLIYRDLLPFSNRAKDKSESSFSNKSTPVISEERHCLELNVASIPGLPRADDAVRASNDDAVESPLGRMSPLQAEGRKEQEMDRNLAELFAQSSSPLFMPQSPRGVLSQASDQPSPGGFLPLSPPLFAPPAARLSPECALAPLTQTAEAPAVILPSNATKSSSLSKLIAGNRQLLKPKPKPAAPHPAASLTSPTPRSLRRVVSENDSPGYRRTMNPLAYPEPASPDAVSPITYRKGAQRLFKSPTKLTKSLSDGAMMARGQQAPANTVVPVETEIEQDIGPWSKTEAFLLFDWCPPNRDRLMLDGYEVDGKGRTVVKRGFLSDQIDAL